MAERPSPEPEFEAIVIGAGVSGLYALHRLRDAGFKTHVFEAGGDVGGTWYWNRYPGARFDSESWTYGYSFSEELMQEWEWSEHFSSQPENLRYLQHVADRFDLRKDITFNVRVTSAVYDSGSRTWEIALDDGSRATTRFLIPAIGPLSIPQWPKVEGICEDGTDAFEGLSFHTFYAPQEPVDYSGKRVAVIGTGATGIQVIAEVAKTAGTLTVFQRHPNWASPLHNSKITPEEQADIKARRAEILGLCRQTYGAFIHVPDERLALMVSEDEREALWEKLYEERGFAIIMANFRDLVILEQSNRMISDFIARKIRQRVHDPATAEKLIPKDHGFGTRRLPLESGYYEVYNQGNVKLVDLLETPLVRITPKGIETTAGEMEFDIIIYATGFDAITGAFDRIEIRGKDGELLKEHWQDGPRTYLGMASEGFPNLLSIVGPHNVTTFCNMPRCIEYNVEWIAELLAYMRAHGYTRVEPTSEAEDAWTETVYEVASRFLFMNVDSWFTGVHGNERGEKTRRPMVYTGGAPMYREHCDGVAARGYEGFVLD